MLYHICSQKKRKQQHELEDLQQHASAIDKGSGFKRDKGKHLGLLKYLKNLGLRKAAIERISTEVLNPCQNDGARTNKLLVLRLRMVDNWGKWYKTKK